MREMDFMSYLGILRELTGTLEELTALQQQKTKAVQEDDLAALNDCMKQEQALAMALRGYEQRRANALAALNMLGVPLSGLTGCAPDECKEEARRTAEDLRRQYQQYTCAAEVARNSLECSLHQIEKTLAELDPEGQALAGTMEPQAPAPMRTDFRA